MRKQFIVCSFFFFLSCLVASAQCIGNCTSVHATGLTDTSGQLWTNGVLSVNIVPPFGNPNPLLNNGVPINDTNTTLAIDSTGSFTISLDDNLALQPSGSNWSFTVCPDATVSVCSQVNIVVTGSSQDVTATIEGILVTPVVNTTPTIYRAYNDSEAQGGKGSLYWNTINNILKGCTATPCSPNNWISIGTGGGGGGGVAVAPPNTSLQFNCGGLLCGDANLTYQQSGRIFNLGNTNTSLNGPIQFVPHGSLVTPPAGNSSLDIDSSGNLYLSLLGATYSKICTVANAVCPGSGTITGATTGGGLLVTGTTLGMLTSCSSTQVLAWNGTSWACAANGGSLSGSGTTNNFAGWSGTSTLGNAPCTYSSTAMSCFNNTGTIISHLNLTNTSSGNTVGNPSWDLIDNTGNEIQGIPAGSSNAGNPSGVLVTLCSGCNFVAGNPASGHELAVDGNGDTSIDNGNFQMTPAFTFSNLTTNIGNCSAGLEGSMHPVSDSSTVTWGATITGGSSNHVLAYCDGSNWTVMAK